jgi:antitoxin ChpS
MGIAIAKWGNSAGMRIPSVTLRQAGLRVGDSVEAVVQADRSILIRAEPQKRSTVDIFAMIDAITPESLPDAGELDAIPMGRELW